MIAKLLEIEQPNQQAKYLSELIQQSSKNSKQFVGELSQQTFLNLNKKVCKQNFELWLRFTISLVSIQQMFQYADYSKQLTTPVLKLIDVIGQQQVPDKHLNVEKLINIYSQTQKSILLHTFLAKHCVKGANQKSINRLLPIFIRLSSYIIEKFLQLKNQPAKDSQDRIQDDKVILKCCQKWVAGNIKLFFKNFKHPQQQSNKKIVLMAICDIMGALLQISRQNIINKQLIENLLKESLLSYSFDHFSWNEIHQVFINYLCHKKFQNPLKKIQIPQIYSEECVQTVGINTQAYTYLIVNYIKSGLGAVASQNTFLKILIPAVGQILSRPYQIKLQAIYMLQKAAQIDSPIQIKSGFQFQYPIQLLFFYLYNFQNEKFESIRSKFKFQKQQNAINSLILLKNLQIRNLTKEKDKYILKTILKQEIFNKKILIILRKFNLADQKLKLQSILIQIAQKLLPNQSNQVKKLVQGWKQHLKPDTNDKIRQKIVQLLK